MLVTKKIGSIFDTDYGKSEIVGVEKNGFFITSKYNYSQERITIQISECCSNQMSVQELSKETILQIFRSNLSLKEFRMSKVLSGSVSQNRKFLSITIEREGFYQTFIVEIDQKDEEKTLHPFYSSRSFQKIQFVNYSESEYGKYSSLKKTTTHRVPYFLFFRDRKIFFYKMVCGGRRNALYKGKRLLKLISENIFWYQWKCQTNTLFFLALGKGRNRGGSSKKGGEKVVVFEGLEFTPRVSPIFLYSMKGSEISKRLLERNKMLMKKNEEKKRSSGERGIEDYESILRDFPKVPRIIQSPDLYHEEYTDFTIVRLKNETQCLCHQRPLRNKESKEIDRIEVTIYFLNSSINLSKNFQKIYSLESENNFGKKVFDESNNLTSPTSPNYYKPFYEIPKRIQFQGTEDLLWILLPNRYFEIYDCGFANGHENFLEIISVSKLPFLPLFPTDRRIKERSRSPTIKNFQEIENTSPIFDNEFEESMLQLFPLNDILSSKVMSSYYCNLSTGIIFRTDLSKKNIKQYLINKVMENNRSNNKGKNEDLFLNFFHCCFVHFREKSFALELLSLLCSLAFESSLEDLTCGMEAKSLKLSYSYIRKVMAEFIVYSIYWKSKQKRLPEALLQLLPETQISSNEMLGKGRINEIKEKSTIFELVKENFYWKRSTYPPVKFEIQSQLGINKYHRRMVRSEIDFNEQYQCNFMEPETTKRLLKRNPTDLYSHSYGFVFFICLQKILEKYYVKRRFQKGRNSKRYSEIHARILGSIVQETVKTLYLAIKKQKKLNFSLNFLMESERKVRRSSRKGRFSEGERYSKVSEHDPREVAEEKLRKRHYFNLLNELCMVLEELSIPPPEGFLFEFACVGFDVLRRKVFLQYVERNVFFISMEFIDYLCREKNESREFLSVLFSKVYHKQFRKTDYSYSSNIPSNFNSYKVEEENELHSMRFRDDQEYKLKTIQYFHQNFVEGNDPNEFNLKKLKIKLNMNEQELTEWYLDMISEIDDSDEEDSEEKEGEDKECEDDENPSPLSIQTPISKLLMRENVKERTNSAVQYRQKFYGGNERERRKSQPAVIFRSSIVNELEEEKKLAKIVSDDPIKSFFESIDVIQQPKKSSSLGSYLYSMMFKSNDG